LNRQITSGNTSSKRTKCNASLLKRTATNFLVLTFLSFLASGCFSKPNLWMASDKSQNHRLVTSFSGEIAAAVSKHNNAKVRMSIFDSLSNNLYKGNVFLALDSQLVLFGGEDSVVVFERKYTGSCGDSRGVITHKLIISKRGSIYAPEKSIYLNYGCEYWGERMIIENVKATDSSIIVYGHMIDKSKDYPLWIEVIPDQ
jgi:hypothetical protein